MKKLALLFFVSLSFGVRAEPISINLKAVSVSQFAQMTYKQMMHRDYVLSPELVGMDKPITVSVSNLTSDTLPKFVEGILASQGVRSVERDGVYYLSADAGGDEGAITQPFPLSGAVRPRGALVGNPMGLSLPEGLSGASAVDVRRLDDERQVFQPGARDAEFIATALNSVFLSKPAAVAGGVVVLSGSKDLLLKVLTVAKAIDVAPHKVKVSASFVEVSTSSSSTLGVSVIANVLGVKLGARLGDSSGASLTLGTNSFQAVIDAIDADGRFKQVSNPNTLVDDYDKSNINFGDSVPTIGSTALDKNGNPLQQINYQQSGVLLSVTPRVLGSGKIKITLDGQVSSFAATTTGVTGSPTLSKRQVQTSLTLDDGEILVIGGLSNDKKVDNSSGFSFLPKSWSSKSDSSSSLDLVLILSATVLK